MIYVLSLSLDLSERPVSLFDLNFRRPICGRTTRIYRYEILLDHRDQLRMQLVHVALTLHSASMLYLPSLLVSSYYECATRDKR